MEQCEGSIAGVESHGSCLHWGDWGLPCAERDAELSAELERLQSEIARLKKSRGRATAAAGTGSGVGIGAVDAVCW